MQFKVILSFVVAATVASASPIARDLCEKFPSFCRGSLVALPQFSEIVSRTVTPPNFNSAALCAKFPLLCQEFGPAILPPLQRSPSLTVQELCDTMPLLCSPKAHSGSILSVRQAVESQAELMSREIEQVRRLIFPDPFLPTLHGLGLGLIPSYSPNDVSPFDISR